MKQNWLWLNNDSIDVSPPEALGAPVIARELVSWFDLFTNTTTAPVTKKLRTNIFIMIYLHILTKHKLIILKDSTCHDISIKKIIFRDGQTSFAVGTLAFRHTELQVQIMRLKQNVEAYHLFVSLLSHFWLIHSFYLHLLYQPYVGLCQVTCVQSHQRQPTSAVAIATCEVQVSAADSHTVPTVATGVSKPLCCRLTLTFTLTSENLSLYITLLLLLVVIQLQPTLLTSWLQLLSYKV